MSYGAESISLLVLVCWMASRFLHEMAHGMAIYVGMKAEARRSRWNPFAYTNWLHHWILPIFGLLLLTMPLPGAMVQVRAEDLRNRMWRSFVAAAGPIATFGLLLVVLLQEQDLIVDQTVLMYWFWIELVGACLNLLPLPGLDGYGMVEPWLPQGWQNYWRDKKQYGPILMMALLFPVGVRSMLRIRPGEIYLPSNGGLLLVVWLVSLVVAGRYLQQQNKEREIEGKVIAKRQGVWLADLAKIEGMVAANPRQVSAGLWIQQSHILQQLERWEEAIAVYEQAVVYHPENARVWRNRGVLLAERGLYDEALASYVQASDLGEDNLAIWHYQADALLELERYEVAIAVFDKILLVMPKDAHILADRGYAFCQLSQFAEARRSLAQAVKLEPSGYNCYWYAQALDGVGETTEALQVVKRALSYDSKDYATAWLMLSLQRRLRDYEAALVTCDALLVNHMGAAQLAYTKAMLRLQMNQPEGALELLRAVAREDLPLLYLRLRCRLLYQAGDYEAALGDCLGALKHEPNHPISLELQGQILVAMGRGVKAIGVYRKLLALRPELFWVRINLGLLLLEARQYGSAQEMFEIGLIDRPEDGDLLYLNAFSLLALDRQEEARVVLEKLMMVMPEHELGRRVYESLV